MLNTKETLSEKFIKRWVWLYVFSFLAWPIGYIIKIIYSHDLSVSEIWTLYWVISLVSLLTVYHDLWLTESLNFFLPKYIVSWDYKKFKSVLLYAVFAQIPTSIIIWGILYLFSNPIAAWYFHSYAAGPILRIFCLFFIWMNIFQIMNTVYWASQNTKMQKWTELFRMFSILLASLIYFLTWNWSIEHYAWNWILWLVSGIIISSYFFYKLYYKPYLKQEKAYYDPKLFKEVFSYALWVLLAQNVWVVLSQIDMQLIIYLLWTKQAWYYTNYLSIIWIPFLVVTPIIWFLFPVVSELHGKGDIEKIKTIKTMFYKYFAAAWIVISAFMFVFSKELAVVLFWSKFEFSWVILSYSAIFLIFNFLLQINFQVLAWTWQVKKRVRILAIWLFFNIPLNLILIHIFENMASWYWTAWSSLAVGLSWIPLFYMSHRATKTHFSWFNWRFFFKILIISVSISMLLWYFAEPFLFWLQRLEMLISILLIWILYIIAIWSANIKELKLFLWELKKMRSKKL